MSWLDFMNWLKPPAIKPMIITPPETPITVPQCGIDLIKELEGCSLNAYADQRGIPTIGYGHTSCVNLKDSCTQEQADAWLKLDCHWAWEAICRNVRVPLTDYQGGALLSFIYNLGETQFIKSRLLRILNTGNYGEVGPEMKVWVWTTLPNGTRVINKGLANRRDKEARLWCNNDWRVA